MAKDYDTYINNELNKLNGYANYLLDFNKKYKQDITGITQNALAGSSQGLTPQGYDRKSQSALEQVMMLYNELKTIGEKGRDNQNLETDIKAFRKKLYEADLPIFEGATDKKDEIYNLLEYTEIKKELEHPNWIMPCIGPIVGYYGEPRATHTHNGIDIAVPVGTPVKAIADGTVVVTGTSDGYGYWVGINHGSVNGIQVSSEYGHLSKWIVHNKQQVKQGQIIAYSGNAGHSEGPHLHLTIRHGNPGKGGGIAVNPLNYICH